MVLQLGFSYPQPLHPLLSQRYGYSSAGNYTRLYIPIGYYNIKDHDEARREGWDLADVMATINQRLRRD